MSKYYYTIGEVSIFLEIKPYVIRYWETVFPQLHPRKDAGRIRKYTEDDILLLKKIKDMLYIQKFTIEGAIQKLKHEHKSSEQIELDLFDTQNSQPVKTGTNNTLEQLKQIRNRLQALTDEIKPLLRSKQ